MACAAGQRPPVRVQRGELPKDVSQIMNRLREEVSRIDLGQSEWERKENLRTKMQRLAIRTDKCKHVRDDMDHDQFFMACQKMHLPVQGLIDVFHSLEKERKGLVNIDDFVNVMIDGNPPNKCVAHHRSHYAKYVCDETADKVGYPPPRSIGEETNFMGSRGRERENRAANWGKGPVEAQAMPSNWRNVSSPVQVHSQQSSADAVNAADFVVEGFRRSIINRGGSNGIHSLGRIFKNMRDPSRKLNVSELKAGLKDFGVSMDEKSLSMVIAAFDRRGFGELSIGEFVSEVRGPVASIRRSIIDQAFRTLVEPSAAGLTMRTIQSTFSAKHYPDVVTGRLPESQAMQNFVAQFDSLERDGFINRDEFASYYKNVSTSIEDDIQFESMMKSLWRIKR